MLQLKLKSLKSRLFVLIYIAMFCIACISMAIPLIKRAQQEAVHLTGAEIELYPPKDLSVSGTICYIYECYWEQKIGSRYHHKEYIVDVGANRYFRLLAINKMTKQTDALLQATKDYQNGFITYEELAAKQIPFTGTIGGGSTNASWRAYQDYMSSLNLTTREHLNYTAACIHPDGEDASIGKWLSLAVLSTLIFIFLLIVIFSGYHQRDIKKYITSHHNPDIAREKVTDFLKSTPEYHYLRYNYEFICGQRGATTVFGEIAKLQTIYLQVRQNRYYFIPTTKSYYLVLSFQDGSIHKINVKKEAYALEHMNRLSMLYPQIKFGCHTSFS